MKNVQEILEEGNLDFNIVKLPMKVDSKFGPIITDYYGLLNESTKEVINTVKAGYHVSQNRDIIEHVLEGIKPYSKDVEVEFARNINGGRKIMIQLVVNGTAKVGDDTLKKYITIIDSNDGSSGVSVGVGDLTLSCQNQFYKMYKLGLGKFRHTSSISEKIKTIPSLIKGALDESMELIKLYNKFESTPASKELVDALVKDLLEYDRTDNMEEISTRKKNQMDALYSNIETEMSYKNGLWGLFSGVTRWTTHDRSTPNRENGRLESQVLGSNARMNIKALEFCKELVS